MGGLGQEALRKLWFLLSGHRPVGDQQRGGRRQVARAIPAGHGSWRLLLTADHTATDALLCPQH